MFVHTFKYSFKFLLRNRVMMFWTLLFPIILSTFLNLALSNIKDSATFQKINIAVADSPEYEQDTNFKTALNAVSSGNGAQQLFHVQVVSGATALSMLKKNDIAGFIDCGDGLKLIVKQSGFGQSLVKEFLDSYLQDTATVTRIARSNPQALARGLTAEVSSNQSNIDSKPVNSNTPNEKLVYFYALIALTCLYGSYLGIFMVNTVQANQSGAAARINLVPVHKLGIFAAGLAAAFVLHYGVILTMLAYLKFILGVSFGNQIGYILLICAVGSLNGICLGALIGSFSKSSLNVKFLILTAISLALSFCAGLMSANVKYYIGEYFPVLRYIDPAILISDSFYTLYYYNTLDRFFLNITILVGMSAVMYTALYFIMRRQKYDHI